MKVISIIKVLIYAVILATASGYSIPTIPDKTYTGKAIKPTIKVMDGSTVLKRNTDYTLSYKNNVNVGTGTIIVTLKGKYSGTQNITFKIKPLDIATLNFSSIPDQQYTGEAIKPELIIKNGSIVLKEDVDYTYNGMQDSSLGKKIITIVGHGNYDGIKSVFFNIVPRDIATLNFSSIPDQQYTGEAIKPELVIKNGSIVLKENVDYTYNGMQDPSLGKKIITIIGHGNYDGIKSVFFNIVRRNIATLDFSSIPDQPYTGEPIRPDLIVKNGSIVLKRDTDYSYSPLSNTDVGKSIITMVGYGNYDGMKSVFFNIVPRDIATLKFSSIPDQIYTGSPITPDLVITHGSYVLIRGTDYTYNAMANINAGKAIITIIGHGNYDGIKSVFFNIVKS